MARERKWYRSEKRVLRPFLHRIWYGSSLMRGSRHLCRCMAMRLIDLSFSQKSYKGWQSLFDPVRRFRKVHRPRRAHPFWTKQRHRQPATASSGSGKK